MLVGHPTGGLAVAAQQLPLLLGAQGPAEENANQDGNETWDDLAQHCSNGWVVDRGIYRLRRARYPAPDLAF